MKMKTLNKMEFKFEKQRSWLHLREETKKSINPEDALKRWV